MSREGGRGKFRAGSYIEKDLNIKYEITYWDCARQVLPE